MLRTVTSGDASFRARIVLLGASNLTRGISTVIETARLTFGAPLEIFAAIGHGRSYGLRSSVFFVRSLPSIIECGIWDALDSPTVKGRAWRGAGSDRGTGEIPTFALITDIGNDIIYGQPPERVAGWIEECIERLDRSGAADIAMTLPPIDTIRTVRPWHYALVKTMLFPTRKLTYADALSRADELHAQLIDLARHRNVKTIRSSREWYGFDPIHIQMQRWPQAWSEILAFVGGKSGEQPLARASLRRWARLRTARPREWRIMGIDLGRSQPAARLEDGTSIWLF
jgi:hypothetical protein